MQKINISIFIIISLVVGGLFGYYLGNNRDVSGVGQHVMPDGTIMNNQGMSMVDMMSDMNKALMGKSGDQFDIAFLEEMVSHHQGAVEMANLALKYAKHQEIVDLSKGIITAQNKEIGDMKNWASSWYSINIK